MSVKTGSTVVTSTPEDLRLVIGYIENGACVIEVLECIALGAFTYDINGPRTSILCYNYRTRQTEIVGYIEGAETRLLTFDLTRLLPKYAMSRLFELVRKNCGLRMWLIRGDECQDPLNPNDFIVAYVFGEVSLSGYTLTAPLAYLPSTASQVEEGTTVTAEQFLQVDDMPFGVRGELHTSPIVDIALCDLKACGGLCDDDSDGCQKGFWIDELGNLGWTNDQFVNEYLEANLPTELGLVLPPTTVTCSSRGQLIVTDGAGTLWYTTLADIMDDSAATWTSIANDVNGDDINIINDAVYDLEDGYTWFVGNANTLYIYDPSYVEVTPVTTVPGVTANLLKIAKCGDHVLLGGEDATLMQSLDNGTTFQTITVIDPLTDLALDLAIDITALAIISDRVFMVGTSDDRTLYTLDGGQTWQNMLIYNADGGTIADIAPYTTAAGTDILYMIRNDAATGRGHMYQTIFGPCEEWVEVPKDSAKTLPDNLGLNELIICPDNHNVVLAVGESVTNGGFIAYGVSQYK